MLGALCIDFGCGVGFIFVSTEIVDDLRNGVADMFHALFVEQATLSICLRQSQPLKQNFLVIGNKRLILKKSCACSAASMGSRASIR